MVTTICFGKLNKEAKIPTVRNGTLDICTSYPLEIQPGEVLKVKTGITVKVPSGYSLNIVSVPSLVVHGGLEVSSGYLTLSSEFEGELILPLRNSGNNQLNLQPGQPLAAATLTPIEIIIVEEFIPEKQKRERPGAKPVRKDPFKFEVS